MSRVEVVKQSETEIWTEKLVATSDVCCVCTLRVIEYEVPNVTYLPPVRLYGNDESLPHKHPIYGKVWMIPYPVW